MGIFLFPVKFEGTFFSFRRLGRELMRCWGGLCPLLLGVKSLQSSQNREATYQEAMEVSCREKLSSLTTNNLGGALFSFQSMKWRSPLSS